MKARQGQTAVPEKSMASQTQQATLEEQVALRAYQLYEQRGRVDGFAEQDWLQAETEVLQAANALKAAA
jgi:hypothetical protein